jgi:hypothetical protein
LPYTKIFILCYSAILSDLARCVYEPMLTANHFRQAPKCRRVICESKLHCRIPGVNFRLTSSPLICASRVGSKRSPKVRRRQSTNPPRWDLFEEPPDRDGIGRDGEITDQSRLATAPTSGNNGEFPEEVHTSQSSIDCGEAESAIGIAQKICEIGSQRIDERITAIPGYRASTNAPISCSVTTGQRLPISSILGYWANRL